MQRSPNSTVRIRIKWWPNPIPTAHHAIVGDVLHNLRPPLDQVLSAIALKFGRTEDHVEFPFRKTFEEFEVALAKQKKLPPDAKALIAAVQPYAGGNDLLFAMHYLNSRDKHRSNLIPINLVGQTSASRICFWRGLPLVIGCKKGQHLVMEAPFNEADLAETGKPLALYDCRPGRVLFGRAEDGGDESLQFMITTPGAKFEADFSPSLNVGFHGVGLDGQPVVAVLNDMRSLVEHLLLSFEAQFFS